MVSIVMPAYNEADIIELSVREWYDEVVSRLRGSELLVVDDCSTDGTHDVLERLAAELPELRMLRPDRNGGHGKALRFGFRYASQPYVFQTDSDRQHVPAEFWDLWNARADYDFIFGTRKSRADGAVRKLITRGMRVLNFMLWQVWIRDANCPFKLMKRSALNRVLACIPGDSFIPMVMVAILARKLQFRVLEIGVTHKERVGGTQSLKGLLKWLKVGYRCARQLGALRLSRNWKQARESAAGSGAA